MKMKKTLLLVLFALIPIQAAVAAEGGSNPAAQAARNKAVARRVFEEIFNQGKFQVADEIYAPDFVNHMLHRNVNLQEDQAAVHAEKRAFPDLTMTVDMMVAEGDLVTVVWTFGERTPVPDMVDCLPQVPGSKRVASPFGASSTEESVKSGHRSINCDRISNSPVR